MGSSKQLFTLDAPHGQGGVFFAWQRTSGGFLATTGYDQVIKYLVHNQMKVFFQCFLLESQKMLKYQKFKKERFREWNVLFSCKILKVMFWHFVIGIPSFLPLCWFLECQNSVCGTSCIY